MEKSQSRHSPLKRSPDKSEQLILDGGQNPQATVVEGGKKEILSDILSGL